MEKGIIAIYEHDKEYANHLMDYLNRKNGFLLEARVFTNEESILWYLDSGEGVIDILLLSEEIPLPKTRAGSIKMVMILTEGGCVGEENEFPLLYKYQSTENMIQKLLESYLKEEEKFPKSLYSVTVEQAKIISIFSTCGGCGKTTLAFSLAQRYGKEKPVLIINLELFPGDYLGQGLKGESGFSELIYYVKQGKSNLALKLKSIVKKAGRADYLLPPDYYEELYELEERDVEVLLKELCEHSSYGVIIFDIGFYNKGIERLLKLSNQVYIPSYGGKREKEKIELFLTMLDLNDNIYAKFQPIILPRDPILEKGDWSIESLGTGILGEFVKKLV